MVDDSRGFQIDYSCKLPNNGVYFRVNVTDTLISLRAIFESLIDESWINSFFPENDWLHTSVLSRVQPTVEAIRKDFDYGINPTVNRDTGEKMVSEISRKILVEDCGHWSIPLAELYKQKVGGNPGFDFHTVAEKQILMFGEAKYVKDATPYINAMTQITDFIDDKKDMKDLYELRSFMPSEVPLNNANKGIKGYVAAFSTNGKTDEYIIGKVVSHQTYQILSKYSLFIVIAVNL